MKPPFPSLTPIWRNDVYPAIEYTAGDVAHHGETIVVTGTGSGLGRETALAFATAGAKQLVLMGRTVATLNETASLASEGWFQTNVKSTILLVKYLIPKASQMNASFLTITAGVIQFPIKMLVGNSGYLVSKLALAKTTEFLAQENPNVFFASIHPGTVDTKIFRASGSTPDMMPMDSPRLAAGFMLWLTKPDAKFLNGKTVWANWDVTELKAMRESISVTGKLNIGLTGWPFTAEKAA
ncbi:uncharacterized protein PG986_011033 [Apiospora aurea]|uniref:Ketoreductase (KR) domain-containing protein n=1 Tax=Apiospora aurea TaxID=335848 RepID=A0ABR1Q3Y2_9PEZI